MSVNLYGVTQRREANRWVDLDSIDCTQDYALIGWLGLSESDRNWTYELKRLSPLRGLPEDYIEAGHFLGEWGFSWLHSDEILSAERPHAMRVVGIPIASFAAWGGLTLPNDWNPLHAWWETDPNISKPSKISLETTYVAVEVDYDFTADFLPFTDRVRHLVALHGAVRFVFGFA